MGIVIALIIAIVLAIVILKKPYTGLFVVIFCEYTRIAMLYPDLGKIHFPRIMLVTLIIGFLNELFLTRNIKIFYYPQNLAQLGFLFVMGLNVLFAYIATRAFTTFVVHLGIIVLYFTIIGLLDSSDKLRRFVQFFLLANVYLALIGLHKYFILGRPLDYIGTGGFTGGSDNFALIINAAIPFAFFLFQTEKAHKKKIIYLLIFAILVTAVVCAFSRGGWVTLIGIAFLLALFSPYKVRAIALISIAAVIILLVIPPEFVEEFKTISPETGTAINRFELWRAAVKMFLDHPILGVGLNGFSSVYGRFYIPENPYSAGWRTVHSVYFQVIAEMGVLGTIFFVLIIYWIIKDIWMVQIKLKAANMMESIPLGISRAPLVSIVGYLLGGVFLSTLYFPPLYVIAALSVALRNTVEREIPQESPAVSSQSQSSFSKNSQRNYA